MIKKGQRWLYLDTYLLEVLADPVTTTSVVCQNIHPDGERGVTSLWSFDDLTKWTYLEGQDAPI